VQGIFVSAGEKNILLRPTMGSDRVFFVLLLVVVSLIFVNPELVDNESSQLFHDLLEWIDGQTGNSALVHWKDSEKGHSRFFRDIANQRKAFGLQVKSSLRLGGHRGVVALVDFPADDMSSDVMLAIPPSSFMSAASAFDLYRAQPLSSLLRSSWGVVEAGSGSRVSTSNVFDALAQRLLVKKRISDANSHENSAFELAVARANRTALIVHLMCELSKGAGLGMESSQGQWSLAEASWWAPYLATLPSKADVRMWATGLSWADDPDSSIEQSPSLMEHVVTLRTERDALKEAAREVGAYARLGTGGLS
jgi:hypothetical protein